MAFNGSGLFVRVYNWVTDRDNGIKIRADRFDAEMDGMATGLSTCVTKDGQTTATARIPLALGVGLGNGTAAAPAINFTSDTDTGFYRIGSNNIGAAVNGAKILDIATTGLGIYPASSNGPIALYTEQTGTGAYTGTNAFGFAYNKHYIISQGIDASGSTGFTVFGRMVEIQPDGGSKANVIAGGDTVTVASTATIDTSLSLDYVGHMGYAKVSKSLGGTNLVGGEKGGIFGEYSVAINNTTNVVGLIGHEINLQTFTGSTQVRKLGVTSVDFGPSTSQGSTYDAAFHVGASGGAVGWRNGLLFSIANGGAPMDATNGKLIATQGSATVNYGFDGSSYTYTTAFLKSSGFSVDGSGNIAGKTTTLTSVSNVALAVGRQGATNPAFNVDASAASQAAGVLVTGVAAGGTPGISVISSATNEGLLIDAKGSSGITLGLVSTGAITLTRATTISAALTYGGVTLSNAVSGTGNMALTAGTTFTGTTTIATLALTTVGAHTISGAITYGGVTLSNAVSGTGNMALTAGTTFTGTTTIATLALTTVGAHTISGAITYGGVTLSNAVTGTGNMALSASPTFTGTLNAAAISATGDITWGGAAWTAYTPTITATTGTFTTVSAAGTYKQLGKLVLWRLLITITTLGSASGRITVPLPTGNIVGTAGFAAGCHGWRTDKKSVHGNVVASTSSVDVVLYDGTFPVAGADSLTLQGWYELA